MKKILTFLLLCVFAQVMQAQNETAPELEFAFEIKCKCDAGYPVGKTSKGTRFIIPIVGGTFEGPSLKGIVLPGGADYQLQDNEHGRTELEAIYSIKTDDGVNIHVRNCGVLVAKDGQFYFRTSPKFEAPNDSKYDWLNNAIFVCVPGFGDGYISLKMWKVK